MNVSLWLVIILIAFLQPQKAKVLLKHPFASVVFTPGQDTVQWKLFKSPELAFEVLFPNVPVFSKGRKSYCWRATDDEKGYVVVCSVSAFPPTYKAIRKTLLQAIKGKNNDLLYSRETTHAGNDALDFCFRKNSARGYTTGRIIWDDKRFMILKIDHEKETVEGADKFFNSLVMHPFSYTNPRPEK